jgi:hypothetical protein
MSNSDITENIIVEGNGD